jgi:aryl-alcohol dehydrogenase-like predicted oxidoreductase
MKTNQLGRSGLRVSELCLGTMTFGLQADEAASFAIMDRAFDAGIFFFDTADIYPLGSDLTLVGRTEEIVGRWLQQRGRRGEVVLATKCGGRMGTDVNAEGLSRLHIQRACEASLCRLGADVIDLYQLHWPDPRTPIEETLRALDDLVRSGKVRYIGCSNYPAWQLATALWSSDRENLSRFESAQPRYNLLFRMIEDEILPLCQAQGVGVIVYNPLAGGMLTPRYVHRQGSAPTSEANTRFTLPNAGDLYRRRYWNDAVLSEVTQLHAKFSAIGKSLTHVALAWVLSQPGISSAIVGARTAEQLADSLQGVGLQLSDEERSWCDDVWFNLPRSRDLTVARR